MSYVAFFHIILPSQSHLTFSAAFDLHEVGLYNPKFPPTVAQSHQWRLTEDSCQTKNRGERKLKIVKKGKGKIGKKEVPRRKI